MLCGCAAYLMHLQDVTATSVGYLAVFRSQLHAMRREVLIHIVHLEFVLHCR